MFTAPINLVVDFLFEDILLAPSADAAKLQNSSAILTAGRRMSNAGRRMSNAGMS